MGDHLIDSLFKALNISNETVAKLLDFKYDEIEQKDENEKAFADYNINQTMIGQKALIERVTKNDLFGVNGFEYAIWSKKHNTIKYLIKYQEIKNLHHVQNEDGIKAVFRLLHYLFIINRNEKIL